MADLDQMLDLQKRYEEAKKAQEAAGTQDLLAGIASNIANRPTFGSIMLGRPSQRLDFSPFKGAVTESPEDILKMYQAQKESEKDRANRLEVEQMKEKQRLAEREQDWQRQLQLRGLEYGQKAKEEQAKEQKELQKKTEEVDYRVDQLKTNLQNLKDTVKKEGTVVFTGPEGAAMDSKLYQIAVDYAKLVDPSSVAREGEVAAAQKYMLPIREQIASLPIIGGIGPKGLGTSNKTAISLIEQMEQDVEQRGKSFKQSRGMQDVLAEQPVDKNQQALEWAQRNPNDPRSVKILQKLQSQIAR